MHKKRTRAAAVLAGAAVVFSGILPTSIEAIASPVTVDYWKGINPVTKLTAESFANPPDNDKPFVRWNWPAATTTVEQLQTDLEDLAAAGIAGVEIGQGGNPSNDQLEAILRKANELGITVGIKYKTGAPIDGTWENTNDYTRKTLNNSRVTVNAGSSFSGILPGTGTIVAVLAYRCAESVCETSGPLTLDRSSVVDLTSSITGTNTDGFFEGTTAGSIDWAAPGGSAGGQWQLVTFRTAAFQNAPELLTKQGTQALIDGYEALWTPQIKELLKKNKAEHFVDSHPTDPWANATELWSSNMKADFQVRAGYNLIPELAALFYGDFKYSDGRDQRVRSDFYQVRNDLYLENRIQPFQEWARSYNMTLRLQPEDPNVGGADAPYQDQIDVAYNLDRPEHESLVGDQVDTWRAIASANSWTGNPWFSEECCAVGSQNYVETLQDVLTRLNKSYVAGITKNVYHVYATSYSPTSTFPGYGNFGPTSFSGTWGPRNPNWASDALQVNTTIARTQQVMTQGRADMDVAVYLHSFEWPAGAVVNTDGSPFNNRFWEDQSLQRAGYTWDYVNPTLLASKDAKVKNGVLNASGPSYKALIVNTKLNHPWHPKATAMSVETARQILEMASDGLRIILVGDAPDETPGDKGKDKELQAIWADILAEPTATHVPSEAAVPDKLAALGLNPDAKPSERSTLLSRHLKDTKTATDYYYLYNQGKEVLDWASRDTVYEEPEACRYTGNGVNPCRSTGEPIDIEVDLVGNGTPYLLDPDSGMITEIKQYAVTEDGVRVRVDLGKNEGMIVALSDKPGRFGIEASTRHVVSTTADYAAIVNGKLIVQDTEPGEYSVRLSDGSVVTVSVADPAPKLDLTKTTWQLAAEDWRNANPFGTTGEAGSAISKTPVNLTLDKLAAWPDIPELADSSGVGTYTTTVTMPANWQPGGKATLSLGQVVDTFTLRVNDQEVPVNQLSAKTDIGAHLKAGDNKIEVRVSTTLNNQLRTIITGVASRGVVQEYGLVGPVTLTPYASAFVDLDRVAIKDATVTPKTLAGKVYLSVSATNDASVPVDIVISTPYGGKTFTNVDPGARVSASINARLASVPAGAAEVKVTATVEGQKVTSTTTATYAAFPTP